MSKPSEWEIGYATGHADARLLKRMCNLTDKDTEYVRGYIAGWKSCINSKGRP